MSTLETISNTTTEHHNFSIDGHVQPDALSILPKLMILLAGCIIIVLNVPAAITVFLTKKNSANFDCLHILSLSLTDTAIGLVFVVSGVLKLLHEFERDYWLCWSRLLILLVLSFSSLLQVFMISLDRLLLFQLMTWKAIKKQFSLIIKFIFATFVLALLIMVIPFTTMTEYGTINDCNIETVFKRQWKNYALFYGGMTSFILISIVLSSCRIIKILWNHKKRRQRVHTIDSESSAKEIQGMKALGIITSTQIMLLTPVSVYMVVHGLSGDAMSPETYLSLASLAHLCSACNPVVYAFRIPEMRNTLILLREKMF